MKNAYSIWDDGARVLERTGNSGNEEAFAETTREVPDWVVITFDQHAVFEPAFTDGVLGSVPQLAGTFSGERFITQWRSLFSPGGDRSS